MFLEMWFAMFLCDPKTTYLGSGVNWTCTCYPGTSKRSILPNDDCRVVASFMFYLHRKRVLWRCKPFSTISFPFFHIFLVVYWHFYYYHFEKSPSPKKNGKQTPFHMETTTSKHQKLYPHLVVYITREKPTKTQGLLSKNKGTGFLGYNPKILPFISMI